MLRQVEQVSINEVLTASIVVAALLIVGLGLIKFWAKQEQKRIEKRYKNEWPCASRKTPAEVDRKLDITEDFYN